MIQLSNHPITGRAVVFGIDRGNKCLACRRMIWFGVNKLEKNTYDCQLGRYPVKHHISYVHSHGCIYACLDANALYVV